MRYTPTIGLEIHIELNTKSKMFCSCFNNAKETEANINICPICMGHPGTLPVINEEAVKKVIKTGLSLNCQIPEISKFDRKNYFYPDLPKGYQISQYDLPICKEGFLKINNNKIRIRRVHLEEDTGRLLHEGAHSLVDFNRAGIPLMELVTEPDLKSAKESRRFAEELRLILKYLDVSEADMEKGQLRIEVNISMSKNKKLGTKVEIKNLNSFRSVERAIDYEIKRQTEILEEGKEVIQETRGWDEAKGKTVGQREKEAAHDYRYFPEPDLPPLHFTKDYIEEIKSEIPELPQQKGERFRKIYNLGPSEAKVFTRDRRLGEYFEKVVDKFDSRLPKEKLLKLYKITSNYLITDIKGLLKGEFFSIESFLISPEDFADFVNLISESKISSKIAKSVLAEMVKTGKNPSFIIKDKKLSLLSDEVEIEKIIKEVILENRAAVQDFNKGKETVVQFLIGRVMAKSQGKAEPKIVEKLLLKLLKRTKS